MTNTKIRKSLVLLLSIFVLVAFTAVIPGTSAFAASKAKEKKLKLPTKAVIYDLDTNEVEKTETFTYDKHGNLTKKVTKEADGETSVTRIKYKYVKGKLVSAAGSCVDEDFSFKFDKNGNIKHAEWAIDDHYFYDYSYDKKGNITKCVYSSYENEKDVRKYTTNKNGTKRTVKGKLKATYIYKNGLLKSYTEIRPNSTDKGICTYKMKQGLVKEKTEKCSGYGINERIVYTYGKTTVSKDRYLRFINKDDNSVIKYIKY